MGGKAIKNSERVSRETLFNYAKVIIPKVAKAFNTEVIMVDGFHDKQDFGDLDLLVLDTGYQDRREILEEHFKPDEIFINSHIISFNYNELQVDLIFTPIENWETSQIFFNWGDLGNFMGKLVNNYGKLRDHGYSIKYGFDGLKCRILYENRYKNIYLTKDNSEVFDFLGLDFNQWEKGFNDIEEVFEYIIGSKYFDSSSFQWENLNSRNRERNKRRPNYIEFLEYIKNHERAINWVDDTDIYLNELEDFFGVDLINEFSNLCHEVERDKIIKSKFNGNIIMERFPDLKGKALGESINGFKSMYSDWETYAYYSKAEKILKEFNNYMDKYV